MAAPMHQKSALPTRALLIAAPTLPFIARCTVSTTPRTYSTATGASSSGSSSTLAFQSGKSTPSCIL